MTPRSSLLLAVLAAIVLAAGWRFGPGAEPAAQDSVAAGTLVFPNLAPKLQEARRIEIEHQGKTLDIARQADGAWGLADRGGFPVQQDKLREMLTALTELRLAEPRTSDPALYARLGVGDPASPSSTADLVRVLDAAGKPIAELITGHRRVRTAGGVPDSIYVRRPGEAQSWLAEGGLSVDADPQLWLARDVADIGKDKVAAVTVTRGDQVLEFARVDGKPALTSPAEHGKLDEYKLSDVFDSLDALSLIDVKPAAAPVGELLGTARILTTDGLVVTVTVFKSGKDLWIRLAASADDKQAGDKQAGAKAEAAALTRRWAGWSYQVGAWKEAAFVPRLEDITVPPPAPAPNAPPAAPPAAPKP